MLLNIFENLIINYNTMYSNKSNPHADKNGHPIIGTMHKFVAFEREKELERRKHLPPEEVAELERVENHLADKMNS